jgi:hypothetical protein
MTTNGERGNSNNRDLDKVGKRGRMRCGIAYQMPRKNQQSMAK